MSRVVLVEGERRSPNAWRFRLNLDEATWDALVEDGIFTSVRGAINRDMRLSFVGFVGLRQSLLVCMPRFGLSVADPVSWLRRVLAVYFAGEGRKSRNDQTLNLHFRNEFVFREVDALATLMDAFAERGLHRRAVAASSPRGSGAVDWERTLARRDPVFVGGSSFYPEPWRWERRSTENEVSRLQAAATAWLARRYGTPVPAGLADAVAGVDLDVRMSPSRSRFDLALLRNERAVTYLASDLRLLDTLEAVVSGICQMDGVVGARLHGTLSFALVWEDALRDLFGDNSAHASLGRADWFDLEDGVWSEPRPAPDRRLDLLVRDGGVVLVLDAKYHYPFPNSRPGWSDIVKQIYYAEFLLREEGEVVLNAFMLPGASERLRLAGLVRVEGAARDFPPVEAWTIDPKWVFSSYGDSEPTRQARARAAFFAARAEVAEVLGNI